MPVLFVATTAEPIILNPGPSRSSAKLGAVGAKTFTKPALKHHLVCRSTQVSLEQQQQLQTIPGKPKVQKLSSVSPGRALLHLRSSILDTRTLASLV
jgi:hypothetical protein